MPTSPRNLRANLLRLKQLTSQQLRKTLINKPVQLARKSAAKNAAPTTSVADEVETVAASANAAASRWSTRPGRKRLTMRSLTYPTTLRIAPRRPNRQLKSPSM